jgi:hypothetical protein
MLVRRKASHSPRPSVRCRKTVTTTENWCRLAYHRQNPAARAQRYAMRSSAPRSHQFRRRYLELFGRLLDSCPFVGRLDFTNPDGFVSDAMDSPQWRWRRWQIVGLLRHAGEYRPRAMYVQRPRCGGCQRRCTAYRRHASALNFWAPFSMAVFLSGAWTLPSRTDFFATW